MARGQWIGRLAGGWVLLVTVAAGLLGCGGPMRQMLTEKRYEPRPKSQEIDLYETGVQTAHEEIAMIDSVGVDVLTTDTRRVLLDDLRERARRIGADAVVNVQMLIRPLRGYVPDPMTPFRSVKQGWTDQHFLRGTAIRFKPPMVETGEEIAGERFQFATGERPEGWGPEKPAPATPGIEVYETMDDKGRPVFVTRPVKPETAKQPGVKAQE